MRHLLKSVVTVSFFAILSRVVSFFFKIFLSNYLGAANLGIYQVATSIFFVLVAVTCTGLPLTISKQTAQFHAQLPNKNALIQESKSVTACIVVGTIFSVIVFALFALFGPLLKPLFADQQAYTVFLLILPALLALGVSSPIRSALWGRKMYTTSSVLEIVEQLLRVGFCVLFVLMLDWNNLFVTAWTFTLSAIVTTVVCAVFYYKKGGRLSNPKQHFKPLLTTGIPITATRISNSVVFMLISISIPFLFSLQGLTTQQSLHMLGASVGMALPLLFVPNTMVGSLAYIMIPTLSQTDIQSPQMSQQINGAIKVSCIIACSFVAAFYVIGNHAGLFLFNSFVTGEFLQYSAWLLIPIALESITSSMLNALELEKQGFVNYLIGSAVMFAVMFSFIKGFDLRVFSLALGLSLTISTVLDIISIKKKTKIKLTFIYPLTICLLMIVPTVAFTQNIYNLLQTLTETKLMQFVRLSITGTASMGFFVLLIFLVDKLKISAMFGSKKQKMHNKKLAKKTKMI